MNLRYFIGTLSISVLSLLSLSSEAQWRDVRGNIDDAYSQSVYFNDIYFFNPSFGFAIGDRSTILSFDGMSWKKQATPKDAAAAFYSISFSSDTSGWIIGENATFYQYNKLNNSWALFKNVEIDKKDIRDKKVLIDVKSVYTVSKTNAWAVADGQHIYNFDGKKWRKVVCEGVSEQLLSVQFVNNNIGFAVGENGVVIKYENGKWEKMGTPTIHKLRSISMVNENYGFAVGENGTFLKYDGGMWSKVVVGGAEAQRLRSVFALSDKKAWAVGDKGIMYCFDGKGWAACSDNKLSNGILTKVLFTGEGQGWVCGQSSFMNYELSVDDELEGKKVDHSASSSDKNSIPK